MGAIAMPGPRLLGLGNRELCSESHIQRAHDALAEEELEAGYSPLARLGRDKLLYAAREGLRSARGRVRTLAPDIAIEPLLLPGALALLQQLAGVADWERVAGDRGAFPWATPDVLTEAVLACIVTGFTRRRPRLVATAAAVAASIQSQRDTTIHLAVCRVLLGAPEAALEILEEDERIGATLGAAALETPGPDDAFPSRDGVMDWIRAQAPGDPLPGLCAFVEKWLELKAIPHFRVLDGSEPGPGQSEPVSLVPYFDDMAVQASLSGSAVRGPDGSLRFLSGIQSILSGLPGRLGQLGPGVQRTLDKARSSAPGGPTLIKRALQLVLGASMLAVLSMLASRQLTSSQREPSAIRQVATLASQGGRKRRQGSTGKEAAIAGQSGAAPEAAEPQPAPRREAPSLARSQAETLIQRWLAAKADAMGPRHRTQALASVLTEPILGAVRAEADEAAASGWFWNIRPLKSRVEYTMVHVGGQWRISSALVIGG
ncbi:hypothetical protein F751_6150 [Auxenochlorella protothecoides]|uniref:Uncharacterized protein n=1 Tax=Auxenochlorella protothecoides TaxID=3075 RepID=A0A087SHJ1_AUXPR|nr:hypothetical protein F751_6150 [Auxenochlorella protothecoides]KFM25195.1 hypothetical protein F751_6150 [Auxenochlorella protothecoides]